ncbi:SOS response-associated peptidase family protein [Sphingomonas abietis]|uniref:Abasic site processing protein n=1 Tax=Sphingomonas abietis TaxID=3012344 RepID=A0ABY7NTU5_9SPHN|nr:SOS response-associated peptidase [Sphingomonas abietis]WBO23866.1 SOS response-associated peptidase [Sphingomonas abietis]
MCNDYRLEVEIASIVEDFSDLKIKIRTHEGTPNVPACADIKISDTAPIVRSIDGERGAGELVNRKWSWPGQGGKPVYNFRSDGREFASGRCLILADGFYEFTDPLPGQKRKTKWLFTMKDHDWFCIAGIWRADPEFGEAFTMLTTEPGQDVAPYHHRQIIPLPRDRWADWLDATVPAQDVLGVLPKGSLPATRVFPPEAAQGTLV